MHRRQYLAVVAAAAIAGCGGGSGDRSGDDDGDAGGGGEPQVDIVESSLETVEGEYSTETYASATVENSGSVRSGDVELTARWYDSDGNLLDDDSESLPSLAAGQTWNARVEALVDDEKIDDFELDGEFEVEAPTAPDGVELVDSELRVTEDGDVSVVGSAENGSGELLDYMEANAMLFDADGDVLAGSFDNQTEVPAGETWSFEIEFYGMARADQIDTHEMLLAGDIF